MEIRFDCPRCGTQQTAGQILWGGVASEPSRASSHGDSRLLLCCGVCGDYSLQDRWPFDPGRSISPRTPMTLPDSTFLHRLLERPEEALHPAPRTSDAPQHCPEGVSRTYNQAVRSLNAGGWAPAGMGFRKVLDLATLQANGKGNSLAARLNDLRDRGLIQEVLFQFATELRLAGNEAAHDEPLEDEDAERAQAEALHDFARLLLVYLYELPGRVDARRRQAQAHEGGADQSAD